MAPITQEYKPTLMAQTSAGQAVLFWEGRKIIGRVIHERLAIKNSGDLKLSWLWHNLKGGSFQALYLAAEDGSDLYARATDFNIEPFDVQPVAGFTHFKKNSQLLREVSFKVLEREVGPGLFRWPVQWSIQWGGIQKQNLILHKVKRSVIKSWLIGGFAMTYVEGVWTKSDGSKVKVFGFAEIIL